MCDDFQKTGCKKPTWRDNILELNSNAVKGWNSLSVNIKKKYVHRAKEEFASYTGKIINNNKKKISKQ
jgi:hypothetical protein